MTDLFDLPPEEALQQAVDAGMTQSARIFAKIVKANTERYEAIRILADLMRSITNKADEEAQIAAFEAAAKFLEQHSTKAVK
jgi:hypothetical protein